LDMLMYIGTSHNYKITNSRLVAHKNYNYDKYDSQYMDITVVGCCSGWLLLPDALGSFHE